MAIVLPLEILPPALGLARRAGFPAAFVARAPSGRQRAASDDFYTAEVHGTLEPCGCTSDPLGDLARYAEVVRAAAKQNAGGSWSTVADSRIRRRAAPKRRRRATHCARACSRTCSRSWVLRRWPRGERRLRRQRGRSAEAGCQFQARSEQRWALRASPRGQSVGCPVPTDGGRNPGGDFWRRRPSVGRAAGADWGGPDCGGKRETTRLRQAGAEWWSRRSGGKSRGSTAGARGRGRSRRARPRCGQGKPRAERVGNADLLAAAEELSEWVASTSSGAGQERSPTPVGPKQRLCAARGNRQRGRPDRRRARALEERSGRRHRVHRREATPARGARQRTGGSRRAVDPAGDRKLFHRPPGASTAQPPTRCGDRGRHARARQEDRRRSTARTRHRPPHPSPGGRFSSATRSAPSVTSPPSRSWKKPVHASAWRTLVEGGKQDDYRWSELPCHRVRRGRRLEPGTRGPARERAVRGVPWTGVDARGAEGAGGAACGASRDAAEHLHGLSHGAALGQRPSTRRTCGTSSGWGTARARGRSWGTGRPGTSCGAQR